MACAKAHTCAPGEATNLYERARASRGAPLCCCWWAALPTSSAHAAGGLLPGYHTFYWLGLTTESWPVFHWTDQSPMNGSILEQGHWGYFMPQNIREPNNIYLNEDCVGANLTQVYDGAWGWSDTQCSQRWPALCRIVPPNQWYYTSPATSFTYIFNNTPVNQQDGELGCQDSGGHLASFHDIAEQQLVRARAAPPPVAVLRGSAALHCADGAGWHACRCTAGVVGAED
jgi:hypothetical protein